MERLARQEKGWGTSEVAIKSAKYYFSTFAQTSQVVCGTNLAYDGYVAANTSTDRAVRADNVVRWSMAIQSRLTVEEFDEIATRPENREKRLEFIGGEIVEVVSNNYSYLEN